MNGIFGQKLRTIRKEQGYTQERLGETLHVSRQTVSYWETGKSQPDYEMLVRIAELLNVPVSELLQEETGQSEIPAIPIPETEPANPPAQKPAVSWRRVGVLLLILFAVLLCAFMFSRKTETSRYSIEQFTQEQYAQDGRAFLELYTRKTPVQAVRGMPGADAFWKYPLFIKETNGVSITIERLTYVTFYQNGKTSVNTLTTDILNENAGATVIGANEIRVITENVPADKNKIGLGVLIEGTDENGNQLSFRHFIPYEYDLD